MFPKSDIGGGRFSTFLRNFEAGMIADIKNIENFNPESDPLFDYVNEVAEHFWQGYDPETSQRVTSSVPTTFSRRYIEGCIKGFTSDVIMSHNLAKYENEDIQNTLKAFGLNKDKFWYLCVCIKDYVDGFTTEGIRKNPTHREEITNLIAEMDKMQPEPSFFKHGTKDNHVKILNGFKTQKNATLTFQLEGSRKILRITDPETISVINMALSWWMEGNANNDCIFLDASPLEIDKSVDTAPVKQLYWFHKYLYSFLKDKVADKEMVKELSTAKSRVSVDKWLLVSRMIYATGLSNKQELNTDGIDYLKNYLKKCNDENMKTGNHNNYYWN